MLRLVLSAYQQRAMVRRPRQIAPSSVLSARCRRLSETDTLYGNLAGDSREALLAAGTRSGALVLWRVHCASSVVDGSTAATTRFIEIDMAPCPVTALAWAVWPSCSDDQAGASACALVVRH